MKKELDVLTEVNNFTERLEDNFSEDLETFESNWIIKNNEDFFLRNKEAYISYLIAENILLDFRTEIFSEKELAERYLNNFYIKNILDSNKWNAAAVNIIIGLELLKKEEEASRNTDAEIEFITKLLATVKMLFNENEVEYLVALENNSLIEVHEVD